MSKTGTGKQYDEDFKKQAIKLAREVGNTAAAEELGIPKGTLGTWMHKARLGEIDTGSGTRDPGESLNLAQQLQAANKRMKSWKRRTVSWKNSTNSLRKHPLSSPRAVGSRERRTVKVHRYKD